MVRRIIVSKRWMIIEYDEDSYMIDSKYYDVIADAIKKIKDFPEQTVIIKANIVPKEGEELEEELEEVVEESEEESEE
jgi:hypothetical protein